MNLFFASVHSEAGTEELARQVTRQVLATVPRETVRNFFDPALALDIRPLLPRVRVPTLVLHGTEDRRIPFEVGQYLAEHIPGAQFYPFPGVGYLPTATAIGEFCEVLRRFVRTGKAYAEERPSA
jgi:pimeloyl-ACP methyl ester carboxylesterase